MMMESYEEQIRFERFLIRRGKSLQDYEFLIEYDTPRQSDVFPVTGRVLIKNQTDDRCKIYRFGSSHDWLEEVSADIERGLI
jgi:hypothetical protein